MLLRKSIVLVAFACTLVAVTGFADEVLYDGQGKAAKTTVKAVKDPDNAKNNVADFRVAAKGWSIKFTPKDTDWSKYKALSFKLYAKDAKGASLMLVLDSNPVNYDIKKGWKYFYKKIEIDWTGWKTVTVQFNKMGKARKPVGFNRITKLTFNSKGWSIKPVKTAVLYVDDIKLITK